MTIYRNEDIFRVANAGGMTAEDIRGILNFFGIVYPNGINRTGLVPIMRDNLRQEEIDLIQGDGLDTDNFVIPGVYPHGVAGAGAGAGAGADAGAGAFAGAGAGDNEAVLTGSLQAALNSSDTINGSTGFANFMRNGEEDRLELYSSMALKKKNQMIDVTAAYARKQGIRLVQKDVMREILELTPLDLIKLQGPMSIVTGKWETDPLTYMALMDQYTQIVHLFYPVMAEQIRGFSMTFLRSVSNFEWKEAAKFEKRIRAELHHRMFERKFDMYCGELVMLNLEMLGVLTTAKVSSSRGSGSEGSKVNAKRPGDSQNKFKDGVCRNWNMGIECIPRCKAQGWKHICQMEGCDLEHKSMDHHSKRRRKDE
jgi:hypothetical protein